MSLAFSVQDLDYLTTLGPATRTTARLPRWSRRGVIASRAAANARPTCAK